MPKPEVPTQEALSAFEAQKLAAGGEGASIEELRPYFPLVRVALDRLGGYLPPDVAYETLEGTAILALLEAADRRPVGSAGFESYARICIWRALTDCLRQSRCFLPETQAPLRRLSEAADKALRTGLEGTDEELAALLSEPLEQLREALAQVAALMAAAPQAVIALAWDEEQLQRRLAPAICALPQLEQLVVAMYYFEDLTFAEIAQVMELSEQEVQWAFGRAAVLLRIQLLLAASDEKPK